jgi:hypothetical protein
MNPRSLHADLTSLLRPQPSANDAANHRPLSLPRLAACIIICNLVYGAGMGTFGGLLGERSLQILYSAIKLPLLLTGSFLLTIPSFFILSTLLGLRQDFPAVLRALTTGQAVGAVVLVSLLPFTLLWYASFSDYPQAVLFNFAIMAIACAIGHRSARKSYRALIHQNKRHRPMVWAWVVLYAFNAIQMAWVMRPFIGQPNQPTTFFRKEAWDNAYIVLLNLFLNILKSFPGNA